MSNQASPTGYVTEAGEWGDFPLSVLEVSDDLVYLCDRTDPDGCGEVGVPVYHLNTDGAPFYGDAATPEYTREVFAKLSERAANLHED